MPLAYDPWEEYEFDEMTQAGLHAETGLGNDNHTAGLTLLHLWTFMKPLFLAQLDRQKHLGHDQSLLLYDLSLYQGL